MVLMNLFAGQQWRCRISKQTCGHSGGRKMRDMLRVTLKPVIPCVKWTAGRDLLYDAGNSNSVLCDNLEGSDGMGGGKRVQEKGHMYVYV